MRYCAGPELRNKGWLALGRPGFPLGNTQYSMRIMCIMSNYSNGFQGGNPDPITSQHYHLQQSTRLKRSAKMKKHSKCKARKCNETAQIRGLCRKHHGQQKQADELRRDGQTLLEKGRIDEEYASVEWIRTDLQELQPWWNRISAAMSLQNEDADLGDEAPYAKEWCMALAIEMVKTERASRTGKPCDQGKAEIVRDRVWRRLASLEESSHRPPAGG